MKLTGDDLTVVETPANDHFVADLARLGALFLRTRTTRETLLALVGLALILLLLHVNANSMGGR